MSGLLAGWEYRLVDADILFHISYFLRSKMNHIRGSVIY
jgi:hypothetical protein